MNEVKNATLENNTLQGDSSKQADKATENATSSKPTAKPKAEPKAATSKQVTTSTETATTETETLESIREEASTAARKLSAALKTDSVSKINAARQNVATIVKKHNDRYLSALYADYLSNGGVLSAVTEGYCSLLQAKETQSKEGVSVELGYTTKVVNLCALEDAANGRVITNKGDWKFQVEALGYLFAARATHDIGGDMSDLLRSYKMDERARKIDLGTKPNARAKDPISNTSLVKAVQIVVDSILFLEQDDNSFNKLKVTNADVSYMLYTMFRKGKDKLSVAMPRKSTIISTVTEVMYKLVNGLAYSAEYERIETKVVPAEKAA